jgi:hypothetical protein
MEHPDYLTGKEIGAAGYELTYWNLISFCGVDKAHRNHIQDPPFPKSFRWLWLWNGAGNDKIVVDVTENCRIKLKGIWCQLRYVLQLQSSLLFRGRRWRSKQNKSRRQRKRQKPIARPGHHESCRVNDCTTEPVLSTLRSTACRNCRHSITGVAGVTNIRTYDEGHFWFGTWDANEDILCFHLFLSRGLIHHFIPPSLPRMTPTGGV